jgi:hypothetical protein
MEPSNPSWHVDRPAKRKKAAADMANNTELERTLCQEDAECSSGTRSTSIRKNVVSTCSAATQTIHLGLAPAGSAGAAASTGSSPPASPLEPAATTPVVRLEPGLTANHAAIAAVELRLILDKEQKAALLVQQGAIAAQRKELNRQAAAIHAGLLAANAKLEAGHQELRKARSYLQLISAPACDSKITAAQSRLAVACIGNARLGLCSLLQNVDIAELIAENIVSKARKQKGWRRYDRRRRRNRTIL